MRTGLTKQEKTTDIWFDEKDPLIHIRTHNTDLKKRLAAYAGTSAPVSANGCSWNGMPPGFVPECCPGDGKSGTFSGDD